MDHIAERGGLDEEDIRHQSWVGGTVTKDEKPNNGFFMEMRLGIVGEILERFS
jgi:hypothetical protein